MSNFETPILFIVFNRPDTTKLVFDSISQKKPKKLYIAADGPRSSISGEEILIKEVRDIVNNITWECDVKTLYRKENIGCKKAVSSAIDWFFSFEEEGIILEDDCLPDKTFFDYCQAMLRKYRNDERIMMISGTNFFFKDNVRLNMDYYFSRYYPIWGWATWKRAWNFYDIDMKNWPAYKKNNKLKRMFDRIDVADLYTNMFDIVYDKKISTWDIQWVYSCLFNSAYSIIPINNLISNIGHDGVHTTQKSKKKRNIFLEMPVFGLDLNSLQTSEEMIPDYSLDDIMFDSVIKRRIPNKKSHFTQLLQSRFVNFYSFTKSFFGRKIT